MKQIIEQAQIWNLLKRINSHKTATKPQKYGIYIVSFMMRTWWLQSAVLRNQLAFKRGVLITVISKNLKIKIHKTIILPVVVVKHGLLH